MLTDVRKHYRFSPEGPVTNPACQAGPLAGRVICFEPGQSLPADSPAAKPQGATIYYVLEGTGLFTLPDQSAEQHVSAGGLLSAEPSQSWAIANPGPARLVVLAISSPAESTDA